MLVFAAVLGVRVGIPTVPQIMHVRTTTAVMGVAQVAVQECLLQWSEDEASARLAGMPRLTITPH